MEDNIFLKEVMISYTYPYLSCSIKTRTTDDACEFAFYVYKNSQQILTVSYQKESSINLNVANETGYFSVRGFVKLNGKIEKCLSHTIFVNPISIDFQQNELSDAIVYNLQRRWSFPALYFPADSPYLFVLCPSAVDRKKANPPVFSRWTWVKKNIFPGNVLCIADPILNLYENINVGWCIGDKNNDGILDLSEIIMEIAYKKRIAFDKIIFYGSSAGGFTALALAACIEGSLAVAINSQTNILKFISRTAVDAIKKYCFGGLDENKIYDNFLNRIDMIDRYKTVNKSRVFLVQNILDQHHYETHYKPFITSLGGDSALPGISKFGRHISWLYSQEGGHVPETIEMAQQIIQIAMSGDCIAD